MLRRWFFAGILPMAATAQSRIDREEVWRQYVEWSTGRRARSILPHYDYRDKLIADGLPMAQVERQVAIIQNRLLHSPEAWRAWFNRLHETGEAVFERRPNAFLAEAVDGVPAGQALDVAMGEGRNAVFLAKRGWEVTGFDISDIGLAVARAAAAKAGVRMRTIQSSHSAFDFGRERWDLIVLLYAFAPAAEPRFAARLVNALRPGGRLVFEHLLDTGTVKPPAGAERLGMPRPGQLTQVFGGLDILRHEVVRAVPDWGPFEPVPMVRLLARKRGRER